MNCEEQLNELRYKVSDLLIETQLLLRSGENQRALSVLKNFANNFDADRVISNLEDVVFESIPDHGDVFELQRFIESCRSHVFIDYDGYGNLATEDKCSSVYVSPSNLVVLADRNELPEWATHIVWYNR